MYESVHPSYHVSSDGGFGGGHSEPLTEDAAPVRETGPVPQQSPGETERIKLYHLEQGCPNLFSPRAAYRKIYEGLGH